jgi:hypothetical protein
MEQLDAAFRQISDELRTQYPISYYPQRATTRLGLPRIDIKIDPATKHVSNSSELSVRLRTGYYAMPSK